MIFIATTANASANNLGKISVKNIDDISTETINLLAYFGKSWTDEQKVEIDNFLETFSLASWKSKIKHLIMPILAPETNSITNGSTNKLAYNLITGTILTVDIAAADNQNVITANGFKRLTVADNWTRNVVVRTGTTYPDPTKGMHIGAYYKSGAASWDQIVWCDYYGFMQKDVIQWGNSTKVLATYSDGNVGNASFRILSLGNGSPVGLDNGSAIPSITGTTTDASYSNMTFSLLTASSACTNITTELSLVTLGEALTQSESVEYSNMITTLMNALFVN